MALFCKTKPSDKMAQVLSQQAIATIVTDSLAPRNIGFVLHKCVYEGLGTPVAALGERGRVSAPHLQPHHNPNATPIHAMKYIL